MTGQPPSPSNSSPKEWPRISLITPVWNSGKYIEQTILSVLRQDYPNLEYIIVDGGSTDGTLDVIRKYESHLTAWISEPDRGMYDALNKGFARTSGPLMGWISATDLLHPGGLRVVAEVFSAFPDVEWITGRPTRFNEDGLTIDVDAAPPRWSRWPFLAGANRYIEQESTFWKRSLWDRAGSRVDDSRRNANDFELWVRFFRHAKIYPVDALIGGFRMHAASLGLQDLGECHRIHDEILAQELASIPQGQALRMFRAFNSGIKKIPVVRFAWWRLIEKPLLYSGRGAPPVIRYDLAKGWVMHNP